MMDGGKEESDTNQPTEGGHRAKDVDDDLTSMCSAEVPSASGSRVSPRAGKRKIRGEDRSGGVAKRKRLRKDEEDGGGTGAESAATPGQDSMAEMKGRRRSWEQGFTQDNLLGGGVFGLVNIQTVSKAHSAISSRDNKPSERVKKQRDPAGDLTQDLLNTSQMLLSTELLEPLGRGAVGKLYIATKPASSTCQ